MTKLHLPTRAQGDVLLEALDYASKVEETVPYQPLYLRIAERVDGGDEETDVVLDDDDIETVTTAIEMYREDDQSTDEDDEHLDAVLEQL